MTQIEALLGFLGEAVTPFHAVRQCRFNFRMPGLRGQRFDPAAMTAGRGYYMTRQGSSLIAVRAGQGRLDAGLRLVGAHTDSPNLSVKPNPVKGRDGCVQLGVDVYGGALLNPWFDRDLAIAGRVTLLSASGELCSTLFDSAARSQSCPVWRFILTGTPISSAASTLRKMWCRWYAGGSPAVRFQGVAGWSLTAGCPVAGCAGDGLRVVSV